MWFGVLGSLLVRNESSAIALPSGKQRVLLATLIMRSNRAVSPDALAEALWENDPPPSAHVTIRNHVKRLRRTLGPDAGPRIVTRSPGYALTLADDECDLLAFRRLYRNGLTAAGMREWQQCAQRLAEALALWRGEPLADVPSPTLWQTAGPELTEMRLQAEESRIEALLRLGESIEIVADLRRLIAEQPLRERFHGQLMIALYRSGRQAEALSAYQAAYRALAAELGVDPGPSLRTLHTRILRGDPGLLAADRPADPTPDTAIAVTPLKRAGAANQPSAASNTTAARTADRGPAWPPGTPPRVHTTAVPTPRQLPAAPGYFAGRAIELKALRTLADRASTTGPENNGSVLISAFDGTAGVGKTALALHWAHQIADQFPDGQLYVNLRGFDPADRPVRPVEAIRGFLDAFGVPVSQIPVDGDAQVSLYRSLLAGKRVLVVLDNARTVDQVRPLIPGSSSCLTVITSRSPLTGLAVAEGAELLTLNVLSRTDAREVLAERLPAERVEAEPEAVDDLIGLCAGLPLALSISAARAASRPRLPLTALVAELRDVRRRLDALAFGDESTDLRAVFSWSARNLSEPAARMFRLLGLHPGPDISLPAAAALTGDPVDQALRPLTELLQASLLTEHTPHRFGFHDLLRAYAAEQAAVHDIEPERHAATRRALDYYLYTAHAAALLLNPARAPLRLPPPAADAEPSRLDDHDQALSWFRAEHQVLLAVIAAAAERGFDIHAWQLAWTLTTFHNRLGYWHDWTAVQRIALDAARRLSDESAQADTQRSLGRAALRRHDYGSSRHHLVRALDLYHRLGDRVGEADTHIELARTFDREDRLREALEHADQSLTLYQNSADTTGPAYALNAIGWYHCRMGDHEAALRYCAEALHLHQTLGDVSGLADTWDSLGYAHHHLGHADEAVVAYQNAAQLYQQAGARYDMAVTLSRIGDTHEMTGDGDAARAYRWRALAVLDELGHPEAEAVRSKLFRQE